MDYATAAATLAVACLAFTGFAVGRWYERRRHRTAWEGARQAGLADLRRIGELAAGNKWLASENARLANELAAALCPRGYWSRMRERSR